MGGIFERTWAVIKYWMKDEEKTKHNFSFQQKSGKNAKGGGEQYLASSGIL